MPENARSPLSSLKPLSERLLFASNFLRHPNMLGSIIPSSRFLVDQVLEPIDWGRTRVAGCGLQDAVEPYRGVSERGASRRCM